MRERISLLVAIAISFGTGIGNAAPLPVAGGELDTSIVEADIYVGTPIAATPTASVACQRVAQYVDNINAGHFADIAELFSQNAVVLEPSRQRAIGRSMIADFYRNTIARMKPEIIAVSYLGDSSDCMVTLAVRITLNGTSRYKIASVDHFTLDATGKFSRMVAYVRP